ncbi:DUF3290 domain-containing protein [Bifidobacterium sp. ESL0763]|uniref:DUF3290 domain-containing protein n=1 Tax=Bifidobacterium sp. ESL0763 TaxID=2983227 RepID=UPI0023F7FDD0|nr:DUF3290 domain-containing protein [Bifidobacterium sp. ESL0763]MDF7663483.1 DUF3290 domain-containing protein [Bifidobacterium sp. ESL0763]
MTFYGIDYLQNQHGINEYVRFFVIIGLCVVFVAFFVLYLRHRLKTKYRDLGIIALLLVALVFGGGYTQYRQSETASAKATQMVGFVTHVARERHVPVRDVLVNSKYLNQNVIVKIGDKFYTVTLNTDYTAYKLTETHMLTDVKEER